MCPVEEVPSFSFVDVDADAAMFRSPAQDQPSSDSVQGSDQASPSKSSLSSAQESKDVNLCKCYKIYRLVAEKKTLLDAFASNTIDSKRNTLERNKHVVRQLSNDVARVLTYRCNANWAICTRRAGKLYKARSRLYRSQNLQVYTRWKALAEIYTIHSFAFL